MTLAEVLAKALDSSIVPTSRKGPLGTAVRQYARMFGCEPQACAPEDYHLPEPRLRQLIETHASENLGPYAVRNLKNNLCYLLKLAREQGWLLPLSEPLHDWRGRRALDLDGFAQMQQMTEYSSWPRYGLSPLPAALSQELNAYLRWCQAPYAPGRPRRIAKRAVSADNTRRVISAVAGFAVRQRQMPAETLSLASLCAPALLEAYTDWLVNVRLGRVTGSVRSLLGRFQVIAQHWLKLPVEAEAIRQIKLSLPPAVVVRDKQKRWLSLAELRRVADSIYPLNARRLQQDRYLRRMHRGVQTGELPAWMGSLRRTAWNVQISLLIRLMLEFPWRQRQFREMRLGQNLRQRGDGRWEMRYHGQELKISHRQGQENRLQGVISAELQPLLEEDLTFWRPRLAPPGEDHMFLSQTGRPLRTLQLTNAVKRATWRFTGIPVTPHLIRDIWATEYLKAHPGDAATVAARLGNTIEVIYKHYAHLLDGEADARANAWIQQLFASRQTS
jgi:integrase